MFHVEHPDLIPIVSRETVREIRPKPEVTSLAPGEPDGFPPSKPGKIGDANLARK